jgi:alkylated DNA repair dioxygenase AlkB
VFRSPAAPIRNPRAQEPDLFGEAPARTLPPGLAYEPAFIGEAEEARLLAAIAGLPLHEALYKEYTARRRIVSFGAEYDFSAQQLRHAEPIPSFLDELKEKTAAWIGIPADKFAHALVTEYRPGTPLGWHRDTPEFGIVAGVSLAAACRMRWRRYPPKKGDAALVLELPPRSAYCMQADARWRWQHSIAPTKALRYSITFRTLRS